MSIKGLIVMVEDEKSMLGFAQRKLKRSGYEVFAAETIEEARSLLKQTKPDLLILDVMLPDGDGMVFCEEIRKESNVLVLFLTGKTQTEDKVRGLSVGGDYYLTKPYELEELVAVVDSLIRRVPEKQDELKVGELRLQLGTMRATIKGQELHLTPKEFVLIWALAERVNNPIDTEELYKKVWNSSMNQDGRALWVQLSRLRKKLEMYEEFEIKNHRTKGYYLSYVK